MLSLDTSGSMDLSGTSDFDNLVNGVVEFVNQLNPRPNDAHGARNGMARFAGRKCSWNRGYLVPNAQGTPVATGGGNGDSNIDLGGTSEYVSPCTNDVNVLTPLTTSRADL